MQDPMTSVGAYTIVEGIAEGGMSFVYRAIDKSQNLEVALKVLKPEASAMIRRHQKTVQPHWEGDIAIQFDHPNVVHTYERGVSQDLHYLAMELLDSFTLKYLISADSPLARANRYHILGEIAEAFGYIHDMGYIHRDVSPRNVLIAANGSSKIIDFGLTIPASAVKGRKDARSGSLSYMAPEQITGEGLDPRCDVYGLGVTMYEVLTKRLPYQVNPAEPTMHLADDRLPLREHDSTVPAELGDVVARALARDPAARFQSVRELQKALQGVLATRPRAELEPEGPEARRFERVDASCFCTLTCEDDEGAKEYRALTRNISLLGASFIHLREPLPEGTRGQFKLWLRGEDSPLTMSAEVVWCGKSVRDDEGYEIGLRFAVVPYDIREHLRAYLASHQ